jgi:putative heme iron utilization protein
VAEKPKSVIRQTDDEARRQARILLRVARFGALAVLDPETGFPSCSRVLLGTDVDGVPVMLGSSLALHVRAILADQRTSLLVGEPGRGDPLAWPRMTVYTRAEQVVRESESWTRIRARFLRRHPKSALYVDFQDFSFFRLVPISASLNGGFGKAFHLVDEDLLIKSRAVDAISRDEESLIERLNAYSDILSDLHLKGSVTGKSGAWKIVGLDASGIDFAQKEQLSRIELAQPVEDREGAEQLYLNVLKSLARN